ncbi:MAG: hypothetical protein ABR569_08940 [Gaiellaceae bacterium]
MNRFLARLTVGIVAAVLLSMLGGGATRATAASPKLTVTESVLPAAGLPVAYTNTLRDPSGTPIATYVSYSIDVARDPSDTNVLTHARISEPVTCTDATTCHDSAFAGATVVSVSGDCPTATYRGTAAFPKEGVSCDLGSLPPAATRHLQIVIQVPAKADTDANDASALANVAALFVEEGLNDSQPTASHTDTFASNGSTPVVTPLTSTATDAMNSFTNPGVSTLLETDPTLADGNVQSTKAVVPATAKGVPVTLSEGAPLTASTCPSLITSKGLTCIGELSTVKVGATFPSCSSLTTACASALDMTFSVFGPSVAKITVNKITVFHIGDDAVVRIVPLCSSGQTDTGDSATGDCVISSSVNKKTGDITIRAQGASNGGWGSAG